MQLMTRTNGYLLRNEGPARGQQAARFVQLKLAGVGLLPAAPGGPGGPGAFPPLPGGPTAGAARKSHSAPTAAEVSSRASSAAAALRACSTSRISPRAYLHRASPPWACSIPSAKSSSLILALASSVSA
jgi:hypothetical protein